MKLGRPGEQVGLGSARSLRRFAGWLGMFAALAFGCAGTYEVPPEFREETVDQEPYRIGPPDLLSIRVWKNPELSTEAPVLPDGTITVPLVGPIYAMGLTTEDLGDLIAGEMMEFISSPDVSVTVLQVNSQRVSVVGGVVQSGPQSLSANIRVVEAISRAGGFTPFADSSRIRVIRATPEGELEYLFNYDAYVRGKAVGTNVRLRPGDLIVVPD